MRPITWEIPMADEKRDRYGLTAKEREAVLARIEAREGQNPEMEEKALKIMHASVSDLISRPTFDRLLEAGEDSRKK
jgi:hypothetical protein